MPRADVWIVKRRRKSGYAYAVRWFDLTTGRMRCESTGRDHKLAKDIASRKRDELRRGIVNDPIRVTWDQFAADYAEASDSRNGVDYCEMIRRDLDVFKMIADPAGPHAVKLAMIDAFVKARLRGSRLCRSVRCQFANTPDRAKCWKCGATLHDRRCKACQQVNPEGATTCEKCKGDLAVRFRAVTATTVNRSLRVLRAAFNFAKSRYRLPGNPFDEYSALKTQEKPIRALKPDEQRRILEAAPNLLWRTFVYLALTTGMRRRELCGLTWDQVDLDGRRIVLTKTKSGKAHGIRLKPQAVELLRKLRLTHAFPTVFVGEGGSEVYWTVGRTLDEIATAAGVERFTCHDLRRTFATGLARAGVNQKVASDMIGHSSVTVTAKYYQAVDDDMADEALAKLPDVLTRVG